MKIRDFSKWCFYLFVFFLPFQIKTLLFTTKVSEGGFFNPYLSQFLYIGDLLLILGILFFALALVFEEYHFSDFKIGNKYVFAAVLSFFVIYALSFFAADRLLTAIYILRFSGFFVFFLFLHGGGLSLKKIGHIFILSTAITAVIGIFQYIFQGSVGLSFFGEPLISPERLGVAKISLENIDVLRAYGTFPHPNVFAGYLILAILLCFYFFKKAKIIFSVALVVLFLALMLTFSRSAFLALFLSLIFYYTISEIKIPWRSIVIGAFLLIFFIVAFNLNRELITRFLDLADSGFQERLVYFSISKQMFLYNVFGVGAGNFTDLMQNYSSLKLDPWLFQPVHNVFLLALNELGIQGFLVFLGMICGLFVSLLKRSAENLGNKRLVNFLLAYLIVIVVIGFFDHYFLSLYQGQALLWLFLGFSGYVFTTERGL